MSQYYHFENRAIKRALAPQEQREAAPSQRIPASTAKAAVMLLVQPKRHATPCPILSALFAERVGEQDANRKGLINKQSEAVLKTSALAFRNLPDCRSSRLARLCTRLEQATTTCLRCVREPRNPALTGNRYACTVCAGFGFGASFLPGARMACRIVPSMRGMNSTTPASPISWMSRLMML